MDSNKVEDIANEIELMAELTREEYERHAPRYKELVANVSVLLRNQISSKHRNQITSRVKSLKSINDNIEIKKYRQFPEDIEDFAGVRITHDFLSDAIAIDKANRELFEVVGHEDKRKELSFNKMGYHGAKYIIRLRDQRTQIRKKSLHSLVCEIQVRTELEDAWARVSHKLDYKDPRFIPIEAKRELHNMSTLIEVAQGAFDRIYEIVGEYKIKLTEQVKNPNPADFLSQLIDYESVAQYTRWKYKNLPVSDRVQELLLQSLDTSKYKTLRDIDNVIEQAKDAVAEYSAEVPHVFKYGTDYITKSLGFVDKAFRVAHNFGTRSNSWFQKYDQILN